MQLADVVETCVDEMLTCLRYDLHFVTKRTRHDYYGSNVGHIYNKRREKVFEC